MGENLSFLCFAIDTVRLGIKLEDVLQVVRAAAVTVLPDAPRILHGVMDYHGDILPVIDMRAKFNLPARAISPKQVFVIIKTSKRNMILVSDEIEGIRNVEASQLTIAADIDITLSEYGILRMDDGIVLLFDVEVFLQKQEEMIECLLSGKKPALSVVDECSKGEGIPA